MAEKLEGLGKEELVGRMLTSVFQANPDVEASVEGIRIS